MKNRSVFRMAVTASAAALWLLSGVLTCGTAAVQAAGPETGRDVQASRVIRKGSGENGGAAQDDGQDSIAEEGWEPLSEEELAHLTDVLDPQDVGFYLSTYTRPEEIKWKEVFYNGAGISLPDTDSDFRQVYAWIEEDYGELYTGVTALRIPDVAAFVEEKTGSDYSAAEYPLELEDDWEWFDSLSIVASIHGDTNYQPVRFERGSRKDETYRLIYTIADPEMLFRARDFCVTLRITGRGWQYISNLPLDPDAPKQLASIEFFGSLNGARQTILDSPERSLVEEIGIEWPEGDTETDGPLYYAVVTALADGVDIDVDEQSFDAEGSRFLAGEAGIMKLSRRQASIRLNRNESVILNVKLTYLPVIRIGAGDGLQFGSYWIGSDPWRFADADEQRLLRPRIITGYTQDLYPMTDDALSACLQGRWSYYDPETGKHSAILKVDRFRDMRLQPAGGGEIEFWMGYQRLYAAPGDASDLITLKAYEDGTGLVPEALMGYENSAGDYIVRLRQEGGEQVLTLIQANNGDAALGYLLDGPASDRHEFEFRRTEGRQTWQTEYKRILSDAYYQAARNADLNGPDQYTDGFRGWYLYDIDKDGIPELILDMGIAEFDRRFEIYTIDEDGGAVFCPADDEGSAFWASHTSPYSYPDGNGMMTIQGHMGYETISKLTLEDERLIVETVLEEDINVKGQDAEYTYPDDIVEGSREIPMLYSGIMLPVDTYAEWSAEGRSSAGAGRSAGYYEEPDWFHAIQNEPETYFLLCPSDPYVNGSGNVTVGGLLEEGTIDTYTPENLVVKDLTYADLNGDGLPEAVMHIGASDSEASQYRVIFSRQDGQIYAYSFAIFGNETVSADGVLSCEDEYVSYRRRVLFDRTKCFEYPAAQ